jgi:hypothetical protein
LNESCYSTRQCRGSSLYSSRENSTKHKAAGTAPVAKSLPNCHTSSHCVCDSRPLQRQSAGHTPSPIHSQPHREWVVDQKPRVPHPSRVPHPRRVFVSAARVGYRDSPGAPS